MNSDGLPPRERLLKLIEQMEKEQKPGKVKGVVEKEIFMMEDLSLPVFLAHGDIWILLFPDGGSGLSMGRLPESL